MKKIFLALLAGAVLTAVGCLKDDDYEPCVTKTLEQDMPSMTKFATDSAITVTQDPTGLQYQVVDAGTGAIPAASSIITVKYVGRRMNGEKFDASENLRYPLANLIPGWKVGIPKIGVGGKIKLIIPSSLAYGCYSQDPMVANQPLYFYVELLKVE